MYPWPVAFHRQHSSGADSSYNYMNLNFKMRMEGVESLGILF
jgi:hypothetical protein